MRRRTVLLIGLPVLVLVVMVALAVSAFKRSPFPVGGNIRTLGLDRDPQARMNWAHHMREPIQSFLKRTKSNSAHFNGSIAVVRPGDRYYWSHLAFLDGIVQPVADLYQDDASLAKDLRVARAGRMRDMLAQTGNDWRIYSHNNHFLDPIGPFTGEITYPAGEMYPLGSWWVIHVEGDVIRSVRRQISLDAD